MLPGPTSDSHQVVVASRHGRDHHQRAAVVAAVQVECHLLAVTSCRPMQQLEMAWRGGDVGSVDTP